MEHKIPPERRAPAFELTPEEQREVDESFQAIRRLMKRKDIDIANVIGLVTAEELESTSEQVRVKFAEETVAQMNMIAFD
jgi:hypothetical protein